MSAPIVLAGIPLDEHCHALAAERGGHLFCPKCLGVGYVRTAAGEALIDFLARYDRELVERGVVPEPNGVI